MCGRLNVIDDPLCQMISELFGIEFSTETNQDLCPSQSVSTIIKPGTYQQLDANWGIQPNWANRLLINAQSETVSTKPTFKSAFTHSRCLVPCTGWYEWRTEHGKKVKYSFTHAENMPFLMGGILYQPENPKLITLTTAPNEKCAEIHKRMPVLVTPENIDYWFNASAEQVTPLLSAIDQSMIKITK